jgi:hypothetical protein
VVVLDVDILDPEQFLSKLVEKLPTEGKSTSRGKIAHFPSEMGKIWQNVCSEAYTTVSPSFSCMEISFPEKLETFTSFEEIISSSPPWRGGWSSLPSTEEGGWSGPPGLGPE